MINTLFLVGFVLKETLKEKKKKNIARIVSMEQYTFSTVRKSCSHFPRHTKRGHTHTHTHRHTGSRQGLCEAVYRVASVTESDLLGGLSWGARWHCNSLWSTQELEKCVCVCVCVCVCSCVHMTSPVTICLCICLFANQCRCHGVCRLERVCVSLNVCVYVCVCVC